MNERLIRSLDKKTNTARLALVPLLVSALSACAPAQSSEPIVVPMGEVRSLGNTSLQVVSEINRTTGNINILVGWENGQHPQTYNIPILPGMVSIITYTVDGTDRNRVFTLQLDVNGNELFSRELLPNGEKRPFNSAELTQ